MSEENNRSSSSSESSSSSSNRSRSSNRSSSRSRGRSRRSRGRRRRGRSTACTSQCVGQQTDNINYKQVDFLRRYVTEAGKIRPRRQTGNCAKHQRALAREIKRARFMALLPYAPAHNFSSGSSGSDRS